MRLPNWSVAILLAACAHTDVVPTDLPPNPPFDAGSWPRPITFNKYDDRQPHWLPDGSGILYSTERGDQQVDKDRCVALVPATGGSQVWRKCETNVFHAPDTTDVWEWPSPSPDGRTLFVRTTGWNHGLKLGFAGIAMAHGFDFERATTIRTLPFITASGRQESAVWTPRWLTPQTVAYLGVQEFWEGETFAPDTFFTGEEVMLLHLPTGGPPSFEVVPGTDYASSVASDADPDAIYYTIGGDSIVYRRHLASGVVDTVHNFGAGRIVRDVSVRGTTLAAIVGDSVVFQFEDAHGWVQRDEGGDLAVVDLATGSEVTYSRVPVWLFRHPEISPDGKLLVVEVQPYAYPIINATKDYDAINHRADLWLFSLETPPLAP